MKTIRTRNGSFLTGSLLADAVLRYGVALCNRQRVDLVDIPVVHRDGSVGRASFTVGWMTDTVGVSAEGRDDELTDGTAVKHLREKAARLGTIRATAFSAVELGDTFWQAWDRTTDWGDLRA